MILDLSKSYSALDMVALEQANHVLLVTQLDLPCLRNVVRLMMSFGEMETVKDKVKIVVNRVGLDNQISLKKAKETMGREVFWQLPNDYRTMVEVRNNGVPLIEQAPKAAITQSIDRPGRRAGRRSQDRGGRRSRQSRRIGKWLNLWPAQAGKRRCQVSRAGWPRDRCTACRRPLPSEAGDWLASAVCGCACASIAAQAPASARCRTAGSVESRAVFRACFLFAPGRCNRKLCFE